MELTRESWTDERLDDFRGEVNHRFDNVDHRFDLVDARFEVVDARFEAVDQRLTGIDQRFDRVEGQIKDLRAESNAFRAETKRSFELVGASLADHNRTLLQAGGGIIAALVGLIGAVVVAAIT
jgi:septation ring formation regulator EzrA